LDHIIHLLLMELKKLGKLPSISFWDLPEVSGDPSYHYIPTSAQEGTRSYAPLIHRFLSAPLSARQKSTFQYRSSTSDLAVLPCNETPTISQLIRTILSIGQSSCLQNRQPMSPLVNGGKTTGKQTSKSRVKMDKAMAIAMDMAIPETRFINRTVSL